MTRVDMLSNPHLRTHANVSSTCHHIIHRMFTGEYSDIKTNATHVAMTTERSMDRRAHSHRDNRLMPTREMECFN